MPANHRGTKIDQKNEHSIHQLDHQRLDPTHPSSVDPANTDPADEAEDAAKPPPVLPTHTQRHVDGEGHVGENGGISK